MCWLSYAERLHPHEVFYPILYREKIDMDGKEDMNRRLLHVYYSNKRDGSDVSEKLQGVPSRQPKRKANADGKVTRKKKTKLAAVGSEMKHASAFHGAVLPSPCFSHLSIDLDGHFDFESDMLGTKGTPTPINRMSAAKGTPGTNNFSFIPVQEGHSSYGIENMMLNNPAFNSAVAKSPANFAAAKSPSNVQHHYAASNGCYYGQYAYAIYPPYPPHGVNAYYRDWLRAAPPIPPQAPPSSDQKARVEGEASGLLKVADFTQKLKDLEESLLTDIRKSSSADQVIKLQVLQSWAKGVWSKPLQPQPENATGVAKVSAVTQSNTNLQVVIEVKSPSPALGVTQVSTTHHSNTNSQVAMKSPPVALADADILTSTQPNNANTHVATTVKSPMPALGVADVTTTTQPNANMEVAIKMESPDSAHGVSDVCNIPQQSNAYPDVAIKMEAPDEDTSMITPGSIA